MKELIFMSVFTEDDGMERGVFCSPDCQFLKRIGTSALKRCEAFPRSDEHMEQYGPDNLGVVPYADGKWLRLQACKHNAARMRVEGRIYQAAKNIQRCLVEDTKLETEWLAMCEEREARRDKV